MHGLRRGRGRRGPGRRLPDRPQRRRAPRSACPLVALATLDLPVYPADRLPPELAALPATKPGSRVAPRAGARADKAADSRAPRVIVIAPLTNLRHNQSAMFRRRHPIPLWRRLQGWLWPHIGWRRLGIYLVKRLTRLPGTPHSIAAGFACGTAISFTPFIGFHSAASVPLSFLRPRQLPRRPGRHAGRQSLDLPADLAGGLQARPLPARQRALGDPAARPSGAQRRGLLERFDEIKALFWPTAVGGVPLGALAGFAIYFPLVRMVARLSDRAPAPARAPPGGAPRQARLAGSSASPDVGIS